LFKEAYGSAADSDLLDAIIPQASTAIERFLNRTLELTTYKRWFDGTGCSSMLLPDWPVTRIYVVSVGWNVAVRVKNTSAVMATVMCDETSVRLFAISTAGVETDSELLFSAYPTITTMAAAINALSANGWVATTETGYATEPSALIRSQAAQYAKSPQEAEIQIADESEGVKVNVIGDRMITRVSGNTTSSGDWDSTELIFPARMGNVFVWWKAGYTFPVDNGAHTKRDTEGNVPNDLRMVCNAVAKAMLDTARQDIGALQSANMTDFSYTLADGGRAITDRVCSEYATTLNKYRRFL
jgi:hypothetical protein